MARDFTKDTANYMSLGVNQIQTLLNGAAKISMHAWVNPDTFNTGANDNRIITIGVADSLAGFILEIVGSAGAEVLKVAGRSVSTDTLQSKSATTVVSASTWHSCGGVFDESGDAITPYYEGAAEGGGAVTFGNAVWTNGTPTQLDTIGAGQSAPVETVIQFDGRIAELAIWTDDIGAAAFANLANGWSPLFFPTSLKFYFPLAGRFSPEPDVVSGKTGSITGSLPIIQHPPQIIYPFHDRESLTMGDISKITRRKFNIHKKSLG